MPRVPVTTGIVFVLSFHIFVTSISRPSHLESFWNSLKETFLFASNYYFCTFYYWLWCMLILFFCVGQVKTFTQDPVHKNGGSIMYLEMLYADTI